MRLLLSSRGGMKTLLWILVPLVSLTQLSLAQGQTPNPIVVENQQPGSTGWMLWTTHNESSFITSSEVVGYTSSPSVNKGGTISFYISVTPAQSYTIEIYRIGWYNGAGGRLMQTIGPLSGTNQGSCPSNASTGLIECRWASSYTLTVPATWTSGVYVASVVNSRNYQTSIVFVVRDDARTADFLYKEPLFTTAAYSNFPDDGSTGKSLYSFNSYGANTIGGDTRAVKVSLDRPTASSVRHISADDWGWENNLIYFLEREGYDVKYTTDLDVHLNGAQLRNFKGVFSPAHDEYWTKEMRDAFEQARDAGVNLAFFGANSAYWQVRIESSSTGTPNRVITCYKSSSLDPITTGSLKTNQFRLLNPPRPEQTMVGVQYVTDDGSKVPNLPPFIAQNTSHWIYANTGLSNGSQVPRLIGYEVDQLFSSFAAPTSLSYTTLGISSFNSTPVNASIYQAPSGAWVFASGTMSWSWAMGRAGFESAGIQQMMRNLLNRFLNGSGSQTPPTVNLTSPTNGATFAAPASITLTSSASTTSGTISKVEFYNGTTLLGTATTNPYALAWTNVAQGSYSLTAKAYSSNGLTSTSSTVAITVTTAPTVSLTSPTNGATFTAPATVPLSASASTTNGTITKVEFYNGTTLLGTATTSPYTFSWTNVAQGSYSLTAKAYASNGLTSTSSGVTITVSIANTAPTVNLTSPTNGATFTAPATVTLTATASTTSGTITKVEFYNGTTLLGTATTSPYTLTWTNVAQGNYSLTAKAYGSNGLSTTSTAVTITVNAASTAPTVSLTSPANGATFTAPATVPLAATASTTSGTITKVEFYNGTALLGTATTSPYTFSWTNVAQGSYSLTAKAYGSNGLTSTSSGVTITVNATNTAPTVSLTSPTSGATFAAPATVTLTATASTTSGTITKVEFYNGTTLLGTATASPYTFSWTNVAQGSYSLTAKAYGSNGLSTTSSAVPITVSTNPIVVENRNTGSTGWMQWTTHTSPNFTTGGQVVGYTSSPSVNKGGNISFYISVTPAQTYTIEIYRLGWYGGSGGRLMQTVGPLSGTNQGSCPSNASTGLIECRWSSSYTLTVPTTWTSGVYVATVINSQNYQANIVFVVRDDSRKAEFLYKQPLFTTAAYSNFPDDGATGKSLYSYNSYGANTISGETRAVKISLDRPTDGRIYHISDDDWAWENNLIFWLEKEGYDVTYTTDMDVHLNGAQLRNYKGVFSPGHDEYWTKEMRDAFEQARDAGVNLAFFGANPVGWQARVEASTSGIPNRVIVCYKSSSLDPNTTASLKTDQFRLLNPPRPEQTLVGVQFVGENPNITPNFPPFVAQNTSHWIYANTGLSNGSQVPGILGYEVDQLFSNFAAPTSLSYTKIGISPFPDESGSTITANSSIYQAPSGAWVFASGTMSWSWALGRSGYESPGIQQMTRNLLNRFRTGVTP